MSNTEASKDLKVVLILAVVLVALIITGVLASMKMSKPDAEPEPELSVKTIEPTSTFSEEDMTAAYLATVKKLRPDSLKYVDDETLLSTGQAVCNMLDEGHDLQDVVLVALDSDVDEKDSGTIIGAAIPAFCPEYTDMLGG